MGAGGSDLTGPGVSVGREGSPLLGLLASPSRGSIHLHLKPAMSEQMLDLAHRPLLQSRALLFPIFGYQLRLEPGF